MKWRAIVRYGDETRAVGPWRRRYTHALADARRDIAPHRRVVWSVEDTRGRSRDLGSAQVERGLEEYHAGIVHRDAKGVWG